MRRIIAIGTALTVLLAASAAYAALNTYTGTAITVSPSKAGTKHKPVPVGFTEALAAANATAGDRAAPLTYIKTTIYGVVANTKGFATCSNTQIEGSLGKGCPKGSLVATGTVSALLGGTNLSVGGSSCDPALNVWNGGANKLWYFFVTGVGHECGSLATGATPPWSGSFRKSGKSLVIDLPLPADVSTMVANHTGLWGSLIAEKLTYAKLTRKAKGKTVDFFASVGCKAGKRPWTVAYTATPDGLSSVTQSVSGSVKSSK